jgi:hypothetical protein
VEVACALHIDSQQSRQWLVDLGHFLGIEHVASRANPRQVILRER